MNPTRSITEGAILTALYSILLIIALYIPLLGSVVTFILPIPFIVYVVRHSLKKSLLLLVVALFTTYMIGSILAIPMTLLFGGVGVVMGYLYSLKKSSFAILVGGSLSFIAGFVLLFVITIVFFQINFTKMITESIEEAEKMVSSLGQSTEQFKIVYEWVELIPYIVPSAMVITSIMFAIITQIISNKILPRLNISVQSLPPFRSWHFPKSMLWYYLIVMIISMTGLEKGTMLFTIIINLLIVLEIIMTIQGLSFVFFYSHLKGLSFAIPMIILIISLLNPILLSIIRIIGIIDLGFDLRKRMKNPQ